MKKLFAALVSSAFLASTMLVVSTPAAAKTVTQKRMENRTKAYQQKSAAKTAAKKASKGKK
jgi:Ni/Co efflux regulator RcnB